MLTGLAIQIAGLLALIVNSFYRIRMRDIQPDDAGAASAILSTLQQAAMGLGPAIFGAILLHALHGHGGDYTQAINVFLAVETVMMIVLVFKDPILGLVAGIQLSPNDMLKLGDWLEMPKYGANGTVTDIGLTTVKVRNFDNTIPTWALVSDAFINWSGMSASGGRRIKRSLSIDTTSIHFLDEQEQQLIQAKLLKPARHEEITLWNQKNGKGESVLNLRKMTNIVCAFTFATA